MSTQNLADRLHEIILFATAEHRRFKQMEELTNIPADRWKNFWLGRQRPTSEMIEAICQAYPQFAFWLTTGCAIGLGHAAPGPHGYPAKSEALVATTDFMQTTIKSRQQAVAVAQAWTTEDVDQSFDDNTLRTMSTLLPDTMTASLKKAQADEANAYLIHLAEILLEMKIPTRTETDGRWREGLWKDVPLVDGSNLRNRLPAVRALLQYAYRNARIAEQMLNITAVEQKIEEKLSLEGQSGT